MEAWLAARRMLFRHGVGQQHRGLCIDDLLRSVGKTIVGEHEDRLDTNM